MTPLLIPAGDFAAYLFDMDGTVADTMPLHFRAWTKIVTDAGGTFPVDLFYEWAGIPGARIVEMLNERFGYEMDPAAIVHDKEAAFLTMLDRVAPIPGVVGHVHAKHGTIPLAIVSGSPRESIVRTLTVLGLLDRFDTVVGSEDYARGKPDPEPFLVAARRLGVDPRQCLVFEDAETGIESAKAAGMQWVRVPVVRG